jgi:hypothetical protein
MSAHGKPEPRVRLSEFRRVQRLVRRLVDQLDEVDRLNAALLAQCQGYEALLDGAWKLLTERQSR